MPDFAPTLESDMPENSTRREFQDITINQASLSNLLECIMQMLQQIQMNPQELKKKGSQPTMFPPELLLEVVQRFQACLLPRLLPRLSSNNCDKLLEMVIQYGAQLFLKTFDVESSRTALHVGVLKGSQALIQKLLELIPTPPHGGDSKLAEYDFILKTDEFGLSAIDMVALIANKDIISCFQQSIIHQIEFSRGADPVRRSPTSEDEKQQLYKRASSLLDGPFDFSKGHFRVVGQLRDWLVYNDIDFVYCLHEAAMNMFPSQAKALEFVELVCNNGDFHILEPLLKIRDSLGRSPWHVCNQESRVPGIHDFKPLFEILVTHFPHLDLNVCDFSDRTPLHWAAAQGFVGVVIFLANQERTNLNATCKTFYEYKMKNNTNFNNKKVARVTPLHLAVIHNHVEVVEALLKVPKGRELNVNAICKREVFLDETTEDKYIQKWTPFQLAAYMGHEQILQVFLKDSRLYEPGLKNGKESAPKGHNMIPALHLATSQFHPVAIKALVDCRKMDILVKDKDENTALHYAAMLAHGQLQVHANLHDYVTVSHFTSKPPKSRKPSDHDIITCIDMLMQSGLDLEQRNKDGITPTLHTSCPEKVQNWWLQKMAREAQENKNNLITATNAVSVTAALVATASFVGPLQPPLGLLDDGNQAWLDGYSQVQHTSVEVFLFCNSLSFYFAIAAIVFAMLPSWPIPHEGLAQEVRIARRCVRVAVFLLFGSIIFVVCAFSAASIAIVPNQRWRYKTIVVISTSLGVLICFLILFLSFMRLLTLISSRNEVAKKISNVATRIMLWE